ncbi:MAG: NAD-dependent epimerase/dehydratase family protein, partial [Chlamydiae bacterium]|nr:NAD-dependent epimerase/dehydratase family protein [Chlamydiota bacterium]
MGKKFLITGASGSIGKALIGFLKDKEDVELYCLVRDPQKLPFRAQSIHVLIGDLLDPSSLPPLPQKLDAAYFFVHSMSEGGDFDLKEQQIAINFSAWMKKSDVHQVIYLSGLGSEKDELSKHLLSRRKVEQIFKEADLPYTILRAAIILGSGSASFEIIRDLVEHLPVMITPKWVNNRSQPLAISDVLVYLTEVANHPECIRRVFEIGGPEIISYREMLMRFAKFRGFHRLIIPVPFLTPKLSSYWIYFVTSTTF